MAKRRNPFYFWASAKFINYLPSIAGYFSNNRQFNPKPWVDWNRIRIDANTG
ncbi:MAG: hypothetical protein K1X72_23885 [Pyrinomonadaceae bacterium]|nr:hypothetical protein [Pyrinomonadaceae bacterium]